MWNHETLQVRILPQLHCFIKTVTVIIIRYAPANVGAFLKQNNMADLTKCTNDTCPMKDKCYRFKSQSDTHNQSYQRFEWYTTEENDDAKCDFLMAVPAPNAIRGGGIYDERGLIRGERIIFGSPERRMREQFDELVRCAAEARDRAIQEQIQRITHLTDEAMNEVARQTPTEINNDEFIQSRAESNPRQMIFDSARQSPTEDAQSRVEANMRRMPIFPPYPAEGVDSRPNSRDYTSGSTPIPIPIPPDQLPPPEEEMPIPLGDTYWSEAFTRAYERNSRELQQMREIHAQNSLNAVHPRVRNTHRGENRRRRNQDGLLSRETIDALCDADMRGMIETNGWTDLRTQTPNRNELLLLFNVFTADVCYGKLPLTPHSDYTWLVSERNNLYRVDIEGDGAQHSITSVCIPTQKEFTHYIAFPKLPIFRPFEQTTFQGQQIPTPTDTNQEPF